MPLKLRYIYVVLCAVVMMTVFFLLVQLGYDFEFILKSEIITAVIFAALSVIIYRIWIKMLLNKINSLESIIKVDKNYDKYIEENELILKCVRPERLRAMILMNISNACCEKRDYKMAARKLMEIDCEKLSGSYEVMCYLYRAYVFFYLGDYGSALYIMIKYGPKFDKLRNNKELEPFIAVLNIFRFIAEDNLEKANEILFIAEQRWDSNGENSDLKHLRRLINKPKREF